MPHVRVNMERKRVMNHYPITRPVTRRSALAGLGAGGLGLALATRGLGANAQDTAPDTMANHPIVGTWYFDFPTDDFGTLVGYSSFHADGTRTDLHPFAGPGIGSWQATGAQTGETILKYQNIAVEPGPVVPGTVTVWETFTVDDSGESVTYDTVVELKALDGTVIALFPFSGAPASRRLVVEPPPPIPTPEAGTPTS
jgi:hypothetical protein